MSAPWGFRVCLVAPSERIGEGSRSRIRHHRGFYGVSKGGASLRLLFAPASYFAPDSVQGANGELILLDGKQFKVFGEAKQIPQAFYAPISAVKKVALIAGVTRLHKRLQCLQNSLFDTTSKCKSVLTGESCGMRQKPERKVVCFSDDAYFVRHRGDSSSNFKNTEKGKIPKNFDSCAGAQEKGKRDTVQRTNGSSREKHNGSRRC